MIDVNATYSHMQAIEQLRYVIQQNLNIPVAAWYNYNASGVEIWVHAPVCKILVYFPSWKSGDAVGRDIAHLGNRISSDIRQKADVPKEEWPRLYQVPHLKGE